MQLELGKNYLITTQDWFFAPDGNLYRAVFGPVTAVDSDEETLGIKTNRGSTNWYVVVGNMIVAGCQVHYVVRTDDVDLSPGMREIVHEGRVQAREGGHTRIYDASGGGRE